ncbi:putative ubiE/COQ5 methyltransferase [Crepidotus variabilis]|uniref:UbiE/COQ5 methyltransferase n=1 Tax=Crepidotus variabilis TaxID=179855 RepID=A0A9P6EKX7_9AGAR|nr:putative ubiE/COQ5 methyltransferase [Crepidotus variabilis]
MPTYLHGHHASVLRSHSWRTVKNSCAYMLPYFETMLQGNPKLRVLDVGCGPGTITCDFASLYPTIRIIGIDASQNIVDQASILSRSKKLSNVEFAHGDIFHLGYPDSTFDIVHVHQVIQHIPDPLNGLRELRRVLKPGGFLAVREVDHPATRWYPPSPELESWLDRYNQVQLWTGGTPDMGRQIHALLRKAGFSKDKMTKSLGTWCFASKEDREWWAGLWAERVEKSRFAENAIASGVCTEHELRRYAEAWRTFGRDEDGWNAYIHGEVVAYK